MSFLQRSIQIVVFDDLIELRGRGQLYGSLSDTHIDFIIALGTAFFKSDLELVNTRGLNENRQGLFGKFSLDQQSSRYIDIENHVLALGP